MKRILTSLFLVAAFGTTALAAPTPDCNSKCYSGEDAPALAVPFDQDYDSPPENSSPPDDYEWSMDDVAPQAERHIDDQRYYRDEPDQELWEIDPAEGADRDFVEEDRRAEICIPEVERGEDGSAYGDTCLT